MFKKAFKYALNAIGLGLSVLLYNNSTLGLIFKVKIPKLRNFLIILVFMAPILFNIAVSRGLVHKELQRPVNLVYILTIFVINGIGILKDPNYHWFARSK